MEHRLTITLPDEVYQPLVEAANNLGQTPEELAAQRVKQATVPLRRKLSEEEERAAEERFARHIGAWSSGDPRSADNERIDADLAREYGSGLEE